MDWITIRKLNKLNKKQRRPDNSLSGIGRGMKHACLSASLIYACGVHAYEKCDYK